MLCSKCGADIPVEARFCGKCGTPVTKSPPGVPVSPIPDKPQPRIPDAKKSRLTWPVILAGAILLALLGGLAVVLMVVGSRKGHSPTEYNYDDYATANPASPSANMPPTPSKFDGPASADNLPANTAQQPANFNAVSDTLYAQKIVGTWSGRKIWATGAIIETRATYSADGYAVWTGTITYFGIPQNFSLGVAWGVRNGICYCRVESSNIQQFLPVGYMMQSKILSLSDEQWTFVDALDGRTETSIRVVPYGNAR